MKTVNVLKDSPVPNNRTAHLKPVIDFLLEQGNTPVYNEFRFDKNGIGIFLFERAIDPQLLTTRFSFPESIKVGDDPNYGGGVIWDKRNALIIHKN